MKYTILLLCLFLQMNDLLSQSKFRFTPECPRPGDSIHIEYTPSESNKAYYGLVLHGYERGNMVEDLDLKRDGSTYVATVKTNPYDYVLMMSFTDSSSNDNNHDRGYVVPLYSNGHIVPNANLKLAELYGMMGEYRFGFKKDNYGLIASFIKKEIQAYPADSLKHVGLYYKTLSLLNKDSTRALLPPVIEHIRSSPMDSRDHYGALLPLLKLTGDTVQYKTYLAERDRKFVTSKKIPIDEYFNRFIDAQTPGRKEEVISATVSAAKDDPEELRYPSYIDHFRQKTAELYASEGKWEHFDRIISDLDNRRYKYAAYNEAALSLMHDKKDLDKAQRLIDEAVSYAKSELNSPTSPKPNHLTNYEFFSDRQKLYFDYLHAKAKIYLARQEYQSALPLAQDVAVKYYKKQDPEANTTLAHALAGIDYSAENTALIESFVRQNKFTPSIKEALKKLYKTDHKDTTGFTSYFSSLYNASEEKLKEDLRNRQINLPAPDFVLKDLDGKLVKLNDFRGKTLVLDFWATWCGPCKASFPALKELILKNQQNTDIVFLFIDTWETAKNKEDAVSKFINEHQYPFRVLMDNDNQVVKDYNITGIPTKFIIDKNGVIRFKSVSYEGHLELIKQMTAMLEIVQDQGI